MMTKLGLRSRSGAPFFLLNDAALQRKKWAVRRVAAPKIELFEDGKVAATDAPNKNARCWSVSRKPEPGQHYYFVKVTPADGNMLWSAPVWVTASGQ